MSFVPDAKFSSVETEQMQGRLLSQCKHEIIGNENPVNLSSGDVTLTSQQLHNKIIKFSSGHLTNKVYFPNAKTFIKSFGSGFNSAAVGDAIYVYLVNMSEDGMNTSISFETTNTATINLYPEHTHFKVLANTNRIAMVRITSIEFNAESYEVYLL